MYTHTHTYAHILTLSTVIRTFTNQETEILLQTAKSCPAIQALSPSNLISQLFLRCLNLLHCNFIIA